MARPILIFAAPSTQSSTQPSNPWQDKSILEVQSAAMSGDAQAQLELSDRYAQGRDIKQDNVESLKWLRQSSQAGCTPAEWKLEQKYLEGDGIPQDQPAAIALLKRLALQHDEKAAAQLAELSPENFKSLAQPLHLKKNHSDPAQTAPFVKVQGKLNASTKKQWTLSPNDKTELTIEPPAQSAEKAKAGYTVTVYGRLTSQDFIKAYLVDLPKPTVEFTYALANPGASTHNRAFTVTGQVHNTSQQPIKSVTLHVKVHEENTALQATKDITIHDLKPGASKDFAVELALTQKGRSYRTAGEPRAEVTLGNIDW